MKSPRVALLGVALGLRTSAAVTSAGVVVTEAGGAVTDGSAMWNVFAMANYSNFAKSFALSDSGSFGRLAWGIGDYATQGSLIAEKLLALGNDASRSVVKGWLAKAPLNDDGHAWGTEGGEFHGGGQGAFEGNAELILIARHYAAFTGDSAAFSTVPERFTCFTDGAGTQHLAGVGHPGLDDSVCTVPPPQLAQQNYKGLGYRFYSELFASPYNQTIGNETLRKTIHAPGKANLQYITLPQPATALSFALVNGAPPQSQWPLLATVIRTSDGATVVSTRIASVSSASWASIDVTQQPGGGPLPAGSYVVTLVPDPAAAPHGYAGHNSAPHRDWKGAAESVSAADEDGASSKAGSIRGLKAGSAASGPSLPTWVIDTNPTASGGSTYVTYLQWSGTPTVPALPPRKPLGQQLQSALQWQLNLSWNAATSAYDVLTIPDPIYRGTNQAAVNSGCSYYDLFRMGFVSGCE